MFGFKSTWYDNMILVYGRKSSHGGTWDFSDLPFLLQSIFQHFDPPHKVFLQIFLTFSLPLKESDLSLRRRERKTQFRTKAF